MVVVESMSSLEDCNGATEMVLSTVVVVSLSSLDVGIAAAATEVLSLE